MKDNKLKRNMKRREFLQKSSVGLAMFGVSGLVLRSDAKPTPRSLDANEAEETFASFEDSDDLKPTLSRSEGPFYRKGSPFRAKMTPPFEPGVVLVVTGRIWSYETKKPLPNTILDLWQVDNQTDSYSSNKGDFKNRARLITNEEGFYEFETVHPKPYLAGPNFWRSPHIHFIALANGHKKLTSEMFFKGDPKQKIDPLFHSSLTVPIKKKKINSKEFESAVFDIVLEKK